jgi:hypothetical protein
MRDPVRARLTDAAVTPAADGKSFTVTGRIAGEPPVHGVVGYLDPEGGSDYDARTVTAAPRDDGGFTLRCDPLVAGKPAALRIVACHANGGTTEWTHAYAVAADGAVDVETMRLCFAFDGFLDAVDDPLVFDALFEAAESWLRERGMTRVLGPFSLSINELSALVGSMPGLTAVHDIPMPKGRGFIFNTVFPGFWGFGPMKRFRGVYALLEFG